LDEHSGLIGSHVALLKLDVEGHEASVLRGAAKLLGAGAIANVIFEEHGGYPSETSGILESSGFAVFGIGRGLLGPRLYDPRNMPRPVWEPPNYLATLAPAQLRRSFALPGWRCLGA
jgi:hypothetical protein